MKAHYHLIGIGGIGMGGLAGLLLARDYHVSGSDVKENDMIKMLRDQGAQIFIGHDAEHVGPADYVAISTDIKNDNPEVIEAKAKNIPVLRRAQLLAQLMQDYISIGVTGAHGKTTTSSMILHILQSNHLSPMGAIGGIVRTLSTNIAVGDGQYFVAEVDDSDGTHLFFHPQYSVITNMDREHLDFYRDLEHIGQLYKQYLEQTRDGGMIFICGDDENLLKVAQSTARTFKTYGLKTDNWARAINISSKGLSVSFDCVVGHQVLGSVILNVPGLHNVMNALASILVGLEIGLDFSAIVSALETFRGVNRRFQFIGEKNGIQIYDDYAHHPTEIAATLKVAKSLKGEQVKRVIGIFQPHRYTRLKHLWSDFINCFRDCDCLWVIDVYAASEQPIEGVSSDIFVEECKKIIKNEAFYVNRDKLIPNILTYLRPGDLVLTLGAGDITKVGKELLEGIV